MSEHDGCSIQITARPAELPLVRRLVERVAEQVGFTPEQQGQLALAVDEALANVIRHGYGGACDQPIFVKLTPLNGAGPEGGAQQGGLEIQIRDFGQQVALETIRSRPLDEIRPGGLGVHIIQSVMDEVRYAWAEGGGMRLTALKRLPPAADGAPGPQPEAMDAPADAQTGESRACCN